MINIATRHKDNKRFETSDNKMTLNRKAMKHPITKTNSRIIKNKVRAGWFFGELVLYLSFDS
jgi:hypothetical protein